MNKRTAVKSDGKGNMVAFERSQFEWDIEDARDEMLGDYETERDLRETRKSRRSNRNWYKINLAVSITRALEAN